MCVAKYGKLKCLTTIIQIISNPSLLFLFLFPFYFSFFPVDHKFITHHPTATRVGGPISFFQDPNPQRLMELINYNLYTLI